MDLVSSISGLQQAQTLSQIQTLVVRKVLDAQQQEGAGALQLLQQASQETDPASAAATGLGARLDIHA